MIGAIVMILLIITIIGLMHSNILSDEMVIIAFIGASLISPCILLPIFLPSKDKKNDPDTDLASKLQNKSD